MKKSILVSTLTLVSLIFLPAYSINITLSKNNLRLNPQSSSLTFTASLDDNIEKLTGSGFIKAKVKLKSKNIEVSPKVIQIPYQDGIIGDSEVITLSLKDTELTKSSITNLRISVAKKFKKRFKIKNLKDQVNIDLTNPKVTGNVTIPSADVAGFRRRSRVKINNFIAKGVTPFNAENPDGVTVELIEIAPNTGEQVGEPLVTAVTDSKGEFEIDLPDNVEFGMNHALLVEGEDGDQMHAPLFSDKVDINPGSEVIFDLTKDAIQDPSSIGLPPEEQIGFDNYTDVESQGLNDQLSELKPVLEPTLEESLAGIKTAYEEFLNNMIAFAADDDESGTETDLSVSANSIAGDYNVVFFDTKLSSDSTLDISVQLTSGRMFKPDEVGSLIVQPGLGFQTSARSFGSNQGGPDQDGGNNGSGDNNGGGDNGGQGSEEGNGQAPGCYEVESETSVTKARNADELGNFYMTVNESRVISFAEASFTETINNPDGVYTFIAQPSVMTMIPVGDNMFLSSSLSTGELIKPDETSSFEYFTGFGSIIKKANLNEGDLTGEYGLVGLGYNAGSSYRSARSFVGDFSIASDLVTYTLNFVEIRQNNFGCNNSSFAIEIDDSSESGTGNLKYLKDRFSLSVDEGKDSVLFTGFATSDKEILTMAYAEDRGIKGSRGGSNVVDDAERQMIFAVKKPSSIVSLAGKSYRLISLNFSLNDQGGRSISAGEVGTLSFDASTISITNFTKTVYALENATSESVQTSVSTESSSGTAFTLSETGAISFSLANEELTGFVSSDTRLIILNSDKDRELGTYLAVLQE